MLRAQVFDQLDAELEWPGGELTTPDLAAVPEWLRFTESDVHHAREVAQKKKSVTGTQCRVCVCVCVCVE
jgi:hypothetical protein